MTNMKLEENEESNMISDDELDSWNKMGFYSKTKYVFQNVTVEPILAFFQISSVLSSLTTQNLNLQKACRVNLKMDNDTCYALQNKNMSFYIDEERQVQKLVANMFIWKTIIQSSIPCILVIFIGSWSDRNKKRKPCMFAPIIGEIIRNVGLLICVFYFNELSMEVTGLTESIPSALAGGLNVLYMAAFSYMGNISSMKNRTLRVGLMNLFVGAAFPIGAALCGVLYQKLGFYGVYYISTALYVIGLVYGLIRIKEHPENKDSNNSPEMRKSCMYLITDFFNLTHVKKAFNVTFREGLRRKRVQLIMLMCIIVIVEGPLHGDIAVGYLYTRVHFNWNEVDYSKFCTFLFMTNIVGVGFSIGVLSYVYKVDDTLIGVISCLSKILAGFIFAFTSSEFVFYFGAVVDMMASSSYIAVRSILSKIVPKTELGQVSAIVAVIETLVPVVYKPLYSAIYSATLKTFPGAYYVIGSIILTPSVFLYWRMYRMNKQGNKEAYMHFVNDTS